ncbi:hypothetical protein [Devriesea agamarum]|uniref:hypothetical protein n=1 Tax=Devriesea agamarum TaxID=472569 RepID=UPI00071CAD39|nr:hypothetical protein [Devriesea agamarum]
MAKKDKSGDEGFSNATPDPDERWGKVLRGMAWSMFIPAIIVSMIAALSMLQNGTVVFVFPYISGQEMLTIFGLLFAAALTVFAVAFGVGPKQKVQSPARADFLGSLGTLISVAAWGAGLVSIIQSLSFDGRQLLDLPIRVNFYRLFGSLFFSVITSLTASCVVVFSRLPRKTWNEYRVKTANEIRAMLRGLPSEKLSTRELILQGFAMFGLPVLVTFIVAKVWFSHAGASLFAFVSFVLCCMIFVFVVVMTKWHRMNRKGLYRTARACVIFISALMVVQVSLSFLVAMLHRNLVANTDDLLRAAFHSFAVGVGVVAFPFFIAWMLSHPYKNSQKPGLILYKVICIQRKRLKFLECSSKENVGILERTRNFVRQKALSGKRLGKLFGHFQERADDAKRVRYLMVGTAGCIAIIAISQAYVFIYVGEFILKAIGIVH